MFHHDPLLIILIRVSENAIISHPKTSSKLMGITSNPTIDPTQLRFGATACSLSA